MKFTMKGADLYESVRHLAPVARTSIEAPNRRIRIRCAGSQVEFAVVGRAMSVRRLGPFAGESFEGDGVVDADVLQKLATRLKKLDVFIEPKVSGEVEVSANNTTIIFPASDGPSVPTTASASDASQMSASRFADVMSAALPFASDDDHRPAMCGVYVDEVDGEVTVTATNGAILYTRTVADVDNLAEPVILPAQLLKIALKLIDPQGAPVAFGMRDSAITLEQPDRFEVIGDAVGAAYPDFRASLPKSARNPVAVFDGRAMLEALEAGRPFLSRSEAVRVAYNGAVTVEVSGECGNFHADIGGEYEGDDARKLAFNNGYLRLACKTLDGGPLRQYVASSLEPQIFAADEASDGVQVVVMPMRL